jgi:hypothetical protein
MPANSVVRAAVLVADLDRARRFCCETLGPDEAFYLAGGRTVLHMAVASMATGAAR